MADDRKVVMAYWDCEYCGNKGIEGMTRDCPGCGHPRPEGVKFYLQKEKQYVEGTAEQHKEADWVCPYCNTLNAAAQKDCASCGAPKSEASGDYFSAQKKTEAPAPAPKKRSILPLIIAAVICFLLVFFLVKSCQNPRKDAVVESGAWKTELVVEEYQLVEVQEPYEELVGYDLQYSDNGDGTFTETEVPQYETKYRTVQENQWVEVKILENQGTGFDPEWRTYTCGTDERTVEKGVYWVYVDTEDDGKIMVYVDKYEDFIKLAPGDEIKYFKNGTRYKYE